MALIACKECGKDISQKAASCPHCGAPVETSFKDAATAAAAVLIFFFVCLLIVALLFWWVFLRGPEEPQPNYSDSASSRSQLSEPFRNYQSARSHFKKVLNCGWEKESPPDKWRNYRLWTCKSREELTDTVAFYINEGAGGAVDSYKLLWRVKDSNPIVLEEGMEWRNIVAKALRVPEITEPLNWSEMKSGKAKLYYKKEKNEGISTNVIRVEPLK